MYVVAGDEVIILDSNIPDIEESIPEFSGNAPFSLDQEVQHGQDIFRSKKDDNSDEPIAQTDTLSWKYLRKTNKYRCFDSQNSSITSYPNEIVYIVKSRYIDTISFFKLKSSSVKLELFNINDDVDNAIPLSVKEFKTIARDVYNYSAYITSQGDFQRILVANIFPYFDTKLRITISINTGGNAEVGNIVYGMKYDLGLVLADSPPRQEIGNLFDIDIDPITGVIKEIPILPKRDLTIPVIVNTREIERITNKLVEYMGKACLWIAIEKTEELPNLVGFGFYKTIGTPITLDKTQYELVIKGVV